MEAAKRVLAEYWSFGGRRLDLEWWSLVGCCVKQGEARAEVWVKILGLPIHLWDLEVFREVGDFCGGFLHVDDETSQITHLKWARIAVQASPVTIPATVKIAVGGWQYEVPLWVEKGT